MRILFLGDSVTDAERDRQRGDHLGSGWVANLARDLPGHQLVNRGISGSRVEDVLARAAADLAESQPQAVSLLVGINHVVHVFKRQRPHDENRCTADLLALVDLLSAGRRLCLCEPFLLPVDAPSADAAPWWPMGDLWPRWRDAFAIVLDSVRRVARQRRLPLVAWDGAMAAEAAQHGSAAIASDGVHPTPLGTAILAREWRRQMAPVWGL